MTNPLHPLLTTRRIGLIGDTEGDIDKLVSCVSALWEYGVRVMVQLGDAALVWPRPDWETMLDVFDEWLREEDMHFYFVDGNHEAFDLLYKYPVSDDGVRWLHPNVGHLPRGWRGEHKMGVTLAALGGAGSLDWTSRTSRVDWWEEEAITEKDIFRLGSDPVDILFGHEAPPGVNAVQAFIADGRWKWPHEDLVLADASRLMYRIGFTRVHPRMTFSGHYHLYAEQDLVTRGINGTFETHATVLDAAGAGKMCVAELDVETMTVDAFELQR